MSSDGKRFMNYCPTLRRLLEIERDEWYGKRKEWANGQGIWKDVSERIYKMIGHHDDIGDFLLEEEDL